MLPTLLIAGTHSGAGKTLITVGLAWALMERGLKIQTFKVGPDYIDPSYHRAVTGEPCWNLDGWMLDSELLKRVFVKGCQGADIVLIEGVMGLFDGVGSTSEEGSSAQIAKILGVPVILVLDGGGLSRSAAAIVLGFSQFDPKVQIAGVLLNYVSSERHGQLLKEAIEGTTGIPVVGFIPRDEALKIPERHLGLVPAEEREFQQTLACIKGLVMKYCDLGRLMVIAGEEDKIPSHLMGEGQASGFAARRGGGEREGGDFSSVRIAYAWDKAFHFYYQDNLDFLEELGAEVIPFCPLSDPKLPEDISGLYFGGGFPEVFAKELAGNHSMMDSITFASRQGIPIYAECGGLMYLSEGITDLEGHFHPMLGIVPGRVQMTNRLQNFGYQEAVMVRDSWIGRANGTFRAHEFHYSTWSAPLESAAYRVRPKRTNGERLEGYLDSHILASYLHLHFLAVPERAIKFVDAARRYQKSDEQRSDLTYRSR